MSEVIFQRSGKSTRTGFLRKSSSTLLVFLCYKVCVIRDRIGNLVGDEILHIAKSHDTFETRLFPFFILVRFVHL